MFWSRRLPSLARLVLAAWLLSLGVAIAAPAVKPPVLEMICSGGLMKFVEVGQDEDGSASLPHCPLCTSPGLAPDATAVPAGPVPACPARHFTRRASPPVQVFAAPLPARGPPLTDPA